MMNKSSLILMSLMFISLSIFMMPGILALNRGRILQNIALWLAIFLGLTLIYKNFGPESAHQLFHFSQGAQIEEMKTEPSPSRPIPSSSVPADAGDDKPKN